MGSTRAERIAIRASEAGVELEERPVDRIVITGFAMRTPLGNTEETWKGLLEGRSGIKKLEVENRWVNIAGLLDFDPLDYFPEEELRRGMSPLYALGVVLEREATAMARMTDENGDLKKEIKRRRVGPWTGSGIGSTQYMIDVRNQLYREREAEGGEKYIDKRRNSGGVSPFDGLRLFPEEANWRIARDKGFQGWGGSLYAACAAGLAANIEAVDKIKTGRIDAAVTSGIEMPLDQHPEVSIGIFAGMREVLSRRNDAPEKAGRPLDKDRDGFVLSSGGASLVIERLDKALERGAPIFAEVIGYRNAQDARDPTNLDIENGADALFHTLYNEKTETFHEIDAIFGHLTGTGGKSDKERAENSDSRGDIREIDVYRRVFGDDLENIPITGNKGNIGHTAGASGSLTLVEAIIALNMGIIPPVANLENLDPEARNILVVKDQPIRKDINTALVSSFGFGGNTSLLALKRYRNAPWFDFSGTSSS